MRNLRRKDTSKFGMYQRVANEKQIVPEVKSKLIPTISQNYQVTKTIGSIKLKYKSLGLKK